MRAAIGENLPHVDHRCYQVRPTLGSPRQICKMWSAVGKCGSGVANLWRRPPAGPHLQVRHIFHWARNDVHLFFITHYFIYIIYEGLCEQPKSREDKKHT
jgi:hypothetical protein